MRTHLVRQGECLTSIATEYGLTPEDIWLLPQNSELVGQRRHSGCLAPGDELIIPESASPGTELRLNELNVLILQDDQYRLIIKLVDDRLMPLKDIDVGCTWPGLSGFVRNTTDSTGKVALTLPMHCEKGMLAWEYQSHVYLRAFDVGTLLPEETEIGMQQRLTNLLDSQIDDPGALITAWAEEQDEDPDRLRQRLSGFA